VVAKLIFGLSTELPSLSFSEKERLLNWTKDNFLNLEAESEFQRLAAFHGIGIGRKGAALSR
jgi:hypothetical protein